MKSVIQQNLIEIGGVDVESELIPVTTHLKPFINVTKRPLSNAQVSKHFSTPKRSKSTETDDEFLWGDLDEHDLINVLNEDLLTPDPTPKVAKVSRNKSKRVTNQIQNLDDSDFFDLSTPTSYDINLDENLCKELNYVPSTTFKFVKESGITKKDKTQIERNKPHIQKLKGISIKVDLIIDSISNTPVGFINRRTLENMANSSVRCTTPINNISEPLRTQENIIQCDLPEFSPSLSVQLEDVPKLDRQESLNSTTTIYKVRLPSESIDLNIQSLETNTQDEIDWDDWITNLDTPESIPLVKLPITTDTSKESDQRNIELMKNIFADMF
ncbi:hypothetical protein BC833DRAFT_565959 [Globomyces pollinis-pini]|nr:hypothetical protein BC833DRAFT_565959 [Globomyces pollinis-pini]